MKYALFRFNTSLVKIWQTWFTH